MSLFEPIRIGVLDLPNRLVMPPMGRARADQDRVPTALMATYYAQRASAGLIVTEGSQVSPASISRPGSPAIHSPHQAAGWRRVTDAVHAADGRIFQQLSHHGRRVLASRLPHGVLPVAPSAIAAGGFLETPKGKEAFAVPKALTVSEIKAVVAEYRQAAINARDAGFDGVEIHAASALLVDQFLRDGTNRRTDDYGGSAENRARFLLEIIDAIGGILGTARIGVRLSPHFGGDGISDSDPAATFTRVAALLGERRIAYLHLVESATTPPEQRFAPQLRTAFGGPVILCGDFTQADAEAALAEGRADLIGFGRAFIANPDLVARLRLGAALNEPDVPSFYGRDARGYIDYPTLDYALAG